MPGVSVRSEHRTDGAILWQLRAPRVCSAGSSGRCSRSPARRTRACSATRSPTRTCSASPRAPGSARRSRSSTASGPVAAHDLLPLGGVPRRRASAVALAYASAARRDVGRDAATLVLAGVTVARSSPRVQTFVQQRNSDTLQEVYSWILGRLADAGLERRAAPPALRRSSSVVGVLAAPPPARRAERRRRRGGEPRRRRAARRGSRRRRARRSARRRRSRSAA